MVKKLSLVCMWYALCVSLVVAKPTQVKPVANKTIKVERHKAEHPKKHKGDDNLTCVVQTAVREAENQSDAAQTGVMYTIHNRVKLTHRSYCNIVNAKSQFSHRKIKWSSSYQKLYDKAKLVMAEQIVDVTHGATFFHDDSLTKNPFKKTKRTIKLDNMVFYKSVDPSSWS